MRFGREKEILPAYPRTPHVPWKAPTFPGEGYVATFAECMSLFSSPFVRVDEKIDGSNCGMALVDGFPLIRNREHILRKGYRKDTPAKMQFKSVWTWFYGHKHNFEALASQGNYSVYGDWMYAQHGLEYDLLPSLFMTYDLFDYAAKRWLDSHSAKEILRDCGFSTAPELHVGSLIGWAQLEDMTNQPSPFTTKGNREGVYVKVSDGRWIIQRFKMVREGFKQGGLWSDSVIRPNVVIGE